MNDQLAQYMNRRYPIILIADPEGGYAAEHPDLPGCFAQGETADETVRALEVSRRIWIEARLELGLPIPEPTHDEDYSGRFVVRIPRSIHAELARLATREGVSLNHYVSTALAQHIGAAPLRTALDTVTRQLQETINDLRLSAKQPSPVASTELFGYSKALSAYWQSGKTSTYDLLSWCRRSNPAVTTIVFDPEEEGVGTEENPFSQRSKALQGSR